MGRRGESFEDPDDDDGSAEFSLDSRGQLQADNSAARKQLEKLDEKEVISLLRTLYLKSGQPRADGRDDEDGRQSRGSSRGCQRGGSRSRSKSKTRKRANRSRSPKPIHRDRYATGNKSTTSSRMRKGLFGRGTSVSSSKRSTKDRRSVTRSKSKKGKGLFGENGRHWGRGSQGGTGTTEERDDHGTKPSKIKVPNDQGMGFMMQNDFEYLNDPYHPQRHPHHTLHQVPPLGLEDPLRVPPQEDYYARKNGHLPPRSPNVASRQPPPQAGQSRPLSPKPRPLPTLQELRSRPGFVQGEVLLQAEPVQAITQTTGLHLSPAHPSPKGPHNTVQGQAVGPPRINSIRGTALSPIVEASDYESLKNGGVSTGAKTPNASNVTNIFGGTMQQSSPPGVINTVNRQLDTPEPSRPASPTEAGNAGDRYDPNKLRSFSDPSSANVVPPPPLENNAILSPGSNDAANKSASLPQQIVVDPTANQREYVTSAFDGGHTFVSDVSSSQLRRDPWNRSPNSVMSQFIRDLEPNKQCCVRGSAWYDALHYACSRLVCDGRDLSHGRDGRDGRGRSTYYNYGRGRDHLYDRDEPDYFVLDPKRLKKKTRRALERFLAEQQPSALTG